MNTYCLLIVSAIAALLPLAACADAEAEAEADPEDDKALHAALVQLTDSIERTEAELRRFDGYLSGEDRAGAYLHLSRMLLRSLEEHVIQDPDFPFFRVLDTRIREGGDNPDQRYLFSRIRGGEAYRIWGNRGSAARIEFQLYAGEPWAGAGRSAGFLDFEQLRTNSDGSFEVFLSTKRQGQNWLYNPADADVVVVRQIYSDWSTSAPGHIHIDKVSSLGKRRPPEEGAAVATRLRNAADALFRSATVWPRFVQQRYLDKLAPNTLSPLIDTEQVGGVKGRWMAQGYFVLKPDQALVIKTWPTAAAYQGIQLTDLWFSSLDYADRITSLNDVQALRAPDGAYYFVVAASDPLYHNWLDTGGLPRGVFLLRFDGVQGDIPETRWPSTKLVDIVDLPDLIPGWNQGLVSSRAEMLRERRRHVQVRFNY